MATRSNIIMSTAGDTRGKWALVYCHWDGDPENVGALLLEHYTTADSGRAALIKGGNLSSLSRYAGPPPAGHSFEHRHPDYCVFYGRDRGDEECETKFFDSLEDAIPSPAESWAEYVYIWTGKAWHFLEHEIHSVDDDHFAIFSKPKKLTLKNTKSNIEAEAA